jgi:cysteine synthase A
MVPDTGERYLSTPLFQDVPETMTEEEEAISASTPGYRIIGGDVDGAVVAVTEPTARGGAFVEAALGDPETPVVMFALEWCEFCWALRRFFQEAGIPYRSVDLDPVAYEPELVTEVRAELRRRIGSPSIPQVFVGGVHVGGSTETFARLDRREPAAAAGRPGIAFQSDAAGDPMALLPKWVHPR